MVQVDITKQQLKLLSKMIWSPDNLKEGFTQQITSKTKTALNKGSV